MIKKSFRAIITIFFAFLLSCDNSTIPYTNLKFSSNSSIFNANIENSFVSKDKDMAMIFFKDSKYKFLNLYSSGDSVLATKDENENLKNLILVDKDKNTLVLTFSNNLLTNIEVNKKYFINLKNYNFENFTVNAEVILPDNKQEIKNISLLSLNNSNSFVSKTNFNLKAEIPPCVNGAEIAYDIFKTGKGFYDCSKNFSITRIALAAALGLGVGGPLGSAVAAIVGAGLSAKAIWDCGKAIDSAVLSADKYRLIKLPENVKDILKVIDNAGKISNIVNCHGGKNFIERVDGCTDRFEVFDQIKDTPEPDEIPSIDCNC